LLVSIVVMVVLHFLLPVTTIIPLPWNVIGIIPLALGIAINIFADNALHKANTTVKPFEESAALVTSGVYQLSRHPMYLGFTLILIGVAILVGSLMPYIVIFTAEIQRTLSFPQNTLRLCGENSACVWYNGYEGV
jgi:protein-S-isoprenylcysteine O-methyltransferase Ste14